MLVIAHALVSVIGFAVCLPAGAILARYLRTSRPWWYTGHWIAQFGVAGPIILSGVILGYAANSNIDFGELAKSDHKRFGTVILVLYLLQCALGAIIHFVKPKDAKRRPIQNYFHAVLGIVVIGLGMYQIHTGFDEEWPSRGLGVLSSGVNVLWVAWCILIVLVYAVGMWLLPRQYAQEAAGRLRSDRARIDEIRMSARGRDDLSP
ncbi:hypothetical protein C8R47DRAFT_995270 [Mycena vitilis]|nr:hypothetical protein C8R47DRAFT_995270 [Mycena vitilis]